ncbi:MULTISPECIES: GTP 3',8-cyclase MoaA [unclassified Rhodococcus (in: high G+C Gram-positive bacteria)]|uniref:GTP 3',8-cyclase MoaA n=1 Tax=unclassified Rhodococcus (in: high G+C Gram-positive bacteria) TaxID=192944 RepID=UPI0016398630|nr:MULTISPECIES: GTP 3',8-cyclase MoaA [unclassified Rhodococcus (in: high G+C Gram-positive bacteria)]MBC2643624.1 GTP 3',8-cyclase MoaA [Rhodococcus sp. 3A]MBC2891635.1 GTP 3',8-cyclase MoaA [Rhodococcus sp. 4CII]
MTTVEMGIPSVRSSVSLVGRPDVDQLVDRFGRVARDLRVSITEKCSLRCTYCMPEEGLPAIPAQNLLTANEIVRLVDIAVHRLGVREVRFTGGEPLMRVDLEQMIAGCAARVPGIPLAMTTNAVGLEHRAAGLARAGLTRVNVSLDSVDREHFARLTRRDRLPSVMAGIRAAARAGLAPMKINAVLMPETLSGAADLLEWCLREGVTLRFIEEMPLDADHEWARENMVTADRLLAVLGERFTLTEHGRDDPSAPAEEWLVDGGPATVGIIASVTRSFCADCDRTRLTAEGTVRSCLFSDQEIDLRAALRSGADDEELAQLWRGAMWNKWAGHGINADGFAPPERSMGAIGG